MISPCRTSLVGAPGECDTAFRREDWRSPDMQRRILGRTRISASEISLGTVELGIDYGIAAGGEILRPAADEAARLLHRALDLGINLIDTARAYGESEDIIGRALEARRSEFHLVSKVQTFPGLAPDERRDPMEASVRENRPHLRPPTPQPPPLHPSASDHFDDRRIAGGPNSNPPTRPPPRTRPL